MNNIANLYTDVINVLLILVLTVTLVGLSSFWIANYAPAFTDLIQGKLPSTEALLRWVSVR